MDETSYDPANHYDRVTEAWGLLLGENLHYGVYVSGDEPLPEATHNLTLRMAETARLAEGLEVLDVGCGTGTPARFIATEHGVKVTGITTSGVGVAEATERTAAAGLADQVRFEVRDGMDNGFPDASFDRAWVLESSHLMRDRGKLIAECARVLRPGGRMALCDIILRRELPFMEVRRLREPLALLRVVYGDARMEPLERYAAWAEEAGLVVDTSVDISAETRPTFDAWRANAEEHKAAVVDLIGEVDWQRFVDSCDVLDGFWGDGTLGYGLFGAAKPA
jgi:cyclopropane fatty-acyl-phospholipid synthase-like methyltransferase